jgi:hypothetical protein
MLAGEPPFDGPTPPAILAKKAAEETPEVRVVRKTVPAKLEGVLAKALATTPADRFQTAGELAEALESPDSVKWRRPRRRLVRRLADVGIAVALLTGGLWLSGIFRRAGEVESGSLTRATFREVQIMREGEVDAAAISPDGEHLAYCTRSDGSAYELRLAEIGELDAGRTLAVVDHCGSDPLLRWLPDGPPLCSLVVSRGAGDTI